MLLCCRGLGDVSMAVKSKADLWGKGRVGNNYILHERKSDSSKIKNKE